MGALPRLVTAAQEGDAHAVRTLDRINRDEEFTGLTCDHCDGEGYVEYLVYGRGAGPEGLEPIYEWTECPHCVRGWQRRFDDEWLDDEWLTATPAGDFPPRLPLEAFEEA